MPSTFDMIVGFIGVIGVFMGLPSFGVKIGSTDEIDKILMKMATWGVCLTLASIIIIVVKFILTHVKIDIV